MKSLHDNIIVESVSFDSNDSDRSSTLAHDDYMGKISNLEMYCMKTFGHCGYALRWRYGESCVLRVDNDGNYETDFSGTVDVRYDRNTWHIDSLSDLSSYVSNAPNIDDIIHFCCFKNKDWTFWSLTTKIENGMIDYYDIFVLPDVNEVVKCKLMAN